jgi:hypothetical protein
VAEPPLGPWGWLSHPQTGCRGVAEPPAPKQNGVASLPLWGGSTTRVVPFFKIIIIIIDLNFKIKFKKFNILMR